MEHPLAVDFVRWIVSAAAARRGGKLSGRRRVCSASSASARSASSDAGRWPRPSRSPCTRWATMLAMAPADRFMLDHLWRWIRRRPAAARHRVLARPALDADGADHHRRRRPDSHLFDRLHARGRVLLALLRVAQPVHVRDAGAGAGGQSVADVRRLGGRGALLVRADRLLVQGPREHHRRQQGVYRQPRRRLGVRGRAVFAVHRTRRGRPSDPGHSRGRALGARAGRHAGLLRDVAGHVRDAAAVRGRDRQVGADSASRMAA